MLLSIILTLVIIGLVLWVVQQLPIDASIKNIIRIIVIVVVVIWLIQVLFGAHLLLPLRV
jgi:hypothetical protein